MFDLSDEWHKHNARVECVKIEGQWFSKATNEFNCDADLKLDILKLFFYFVKFEVRSLCRSHYSNNPSKGFSISLFEPNL